MWRVDHVMEDVKITVGGVNDRYLVQGRRRISDNLLLEVSITGNNI